jgi:hypothetical protein
MVVSQKEPESNKDTVVYRLKDVDTKPSFVVVERPNFPERLIQLVQSEEVDSIVFEAIINQTGILEHVVIVQSPSPEHSQALRNALVNWVATPGKIKGNPVRTKIRQKIEIR